MVGMPLEQRKFFSYTNIFFVFVEECPWHANTHIVFCSLVGSMQYSSFWLCGQEKSCPIHYSQALVLYFPGCVIAELFTEGVPLFDLSQLLAYRNGQFAPDQVLNKIEDRSIRELVNNLPIFMAAYCNFHTSLITKATLSVFFFLSRLSLCSFLMASV